MTIIGICFILFGVLVILNPALLAYIVAFFFIFVGANILLFAFSLKKMRTQHPNNDKIFSFGKYEFTRKK